MAEQSYIPHSHLPYGKDGTGSYSKNNDGAHDAHDVNIPLIVDAVQTTDIKPGSVFTAVDYGAADGGMSMRLWYACVKSVREKYGDELPINIIYEDQPVNDFKSVFMRIQGLIPSSFRSYLHDFPNVYVLASGTNFYEQCLPNNSVHIGFSSTAMHWLSKKPCHLTESILVYHNTVQEENKKFREQAARDWEQILLMRAAELVPGGKAIICTLAMDEHGNFTAGPSINAKVGIANLMTSLWKTMQHEGIITKKEFVATNLYAYCPTKEECIKPFDHPDSLVRQAGLELVSIETCLIPDYYREKWLKEKGDPAEHAKRVVASFREWSNASFYGGLSDSRATTEKDQIVDNLYRRCTDEISKNPEDHGLDMIYAYIVIRKKT